MWCHSTSAESAARNEGPGGPNEQTLAPTNSPITGKTSWSARAGALLLAGGLATAPHVPCLLGLVGAGATGYLGWRSLCDHADPQLSQEISLRRLDAVPEAYEEFSPAAAANAVVRVLDAQPGLHEVMAAKSSEANGATIQVVVVENEEDRCVVVGLCREGMLCPCSKPQFFNAGHFDDLQKPEVYPGQHEILNALYYPDGTRR